MKSMSPATKINYQLLIQQTLQDLRESPADLYNPLDSMLEGYREFLQSLSRHQVRQLRKELLYQITHEEDLSTRFVLKLMYGVTDAVYEGHQLIYMAPVSV